MRSTKGRGESVGNSTLVLLTPCGLVLQLAPSATTHPLQLPLSLALSSSYLAARYRLPATCYPLPTWCFLLPSRPCLVVL